MNELIKSKDLVLVVFKKKRKISMKTRRLLKFGDEGHQQHLSKKMEKFPIERK